MRKYFVLTTILLGTAVSLTLILTQLQAAPTGNDTYTVSDLIYDADLGGTLSDQTFEYAAVGKSPKDGGCPQLPPFCPEATQVYSATMPGTILNSMSEIDDYAGYAITPTLAPTLTRSAGFKLDFRLRIVEESTESNDRAGFVVILLGEDAKGIEVSFWDDEIWVQEDNETNELPLFTHAEGVAYTTTNWVNYELMILDNMYSLSANSTEILSGTVRDYSAWEPPSYPGFTIPDPYETPNLIFFGDNSSQGRSQAWIQDITIHYNIEYNSFLPMITN